MNWKSLFMVSIYIIQRQHTRLKIIILLFINLINSVSTAAQNSSSQRDSLLKTISSGAQKEGRIAALNALAKSYWNNKNDSAVFYADSARRTASRLGNISGKAEANRIIGVAKWYQGKKPEEIQPYLDTAIFLYKSTGEKKGIADAYNNLGSFWTYAGNYPLSLSFYDSSLILYRKLGDKKGEAAVLNYIGIVYQYMGDFSKAIDYTLQGLMIRKTTNDDFGIVFSYLNVGNIFLAGGQPETAIKYYQEGINHSHDKKIDPPAMAYNVMGNAYLQTGKLDSAAEYLLPGKTLVNKYPDDLLVARLYLIKGELDKSERYFQQVINNPGTNTREDRQAKAMAGIARILQLKGKFSEAISMCYKSYSLAGPINKLTLAESAGILSTLFEQQGNVEKALSFLKIQHGILDSVTNRNYQNKLAYFETSAEIEKVQTRLAAVSVQKALQEKLYKQERLLKNVLIGISILILLAAFLVFRNIDARRKKILVQNELLDEQNKKITKTYDQLRAAQAQLIQSEKMASLGELTAGIAHEIQNPLNFVNNFSELNKELLLEMKDEISKGNFIDVSSIAENVIQNQEKINLHGKRADAIVKGMLQHSQRGNSIMQPTNLNALVDEYLRLAYHGFTAKGNPDSISILTDFDRHIDLISIIPQDIGRVLLNIYNNAFYAVSERASREQNGYEPKVTVTTKVSGEKESGIRNPQSVIISIKDNGNGIPDHALKKIFQPFFTTKPTGQGTGLGLSLSYDIIKAHGGELTAYSVDGEGTSIQIQLPV